MTRNIDLRGMDRDTLLAIGTRACDQLCAIANMLTSDEGDEDDTEDEFGLPASEIVEMAHDNMIGDARRTLDSILAKLATPPAENNLSGTTAKPSVPLTVQDDLPPQNPTGGEPG